MKIYTLTSPLQNLTAELLVSADMSLNVKVCILNIRSDLNIFEQLKILAWLI